ncbi:hypothetical protein SLE2022_382110 [Rubroshorea leprosula]
MIPIPRYGPLIHGRNSCSEERSGKSREKFALNPQILPSQIEAWEDEHEQSKFCSGIRSACRRWHTCAKSYLLTSSWPQHQQPWFLALPTRNRGQCCYAHNPVTGNWHMLSLDFFSVPVRPVASIGSLILLRSTNSTILQLAICNPFTREFRQLPALNITRTNPAVGIVLLESGQHGNSLCFMIYVAGGMSDAPRGGATYESTLEMYDSRTGTWQIVGPMPTEFAVRVTVWTPNDSVYTDGVLYWMTSARAYSVMALEIGSNRWRELSVPLSDRLEFAALVRRNGRLTLVGGMLDGGDGCIWELEEGEKWVLIENVPVELGMRLIGGKRSWGSTKCVGSDGAIWLYREIGSGMVVWRQVEGKGKWEWVWVEGCCFVRGKMVQNLIIKGVLLQPNLANSSCLNC